MEFLPVKDLNKHRVCDLRQDCKELIIVRGNCKTIITVNSEGTLAVKYEVVSPVK